jgi:hypothetical protein
MFGKLKSFKLFSMRKTKRSDTDAECDTNTHKDSVIDHILHGDEVTFASVGAELRVKVGVAGCVNACRVCPPRLHTHGTDGC